MNAKSGDIIVINNVVYWVCDCKDFPINEVFKILCNLCKCHRPDKNIGLFALQAAENALRAAKELSGVTKSNK